MCLDKNQKTHTAILQIIRENIKNAKKSTKTCMSLVKCWRSSMVEFLASNQTMRVQSSSPAPNTFLFDYFVEIGRMMIHHSANFNIR